MTTGAIYRIERVKQVAELPVLKPGVESVLPATIDDNDIDTAFKHLFPLVVPASGKEHERDGIERTNKQYKTMFRSFIRHLATQPDSLPGTRMTLKDASEDLATFCKELNSFVRKRTGAESFMHKLRGRLFNLRTEALTADIQNDARVPGDSAGKLRATVAGHFDQVLAIEGTSIDKLIEGRARADFESYKQKFSAAFPKIGAKANTLFNELSFYFDAVANAR